MKMIREKNAKLRRGKFLFPLGAFCSAVLCAVFLLSALPTNGEEAIYDRVVRLHVIANSDQTEDQSLKLAVRDRILDRFGDRLLIQTDNAAAAAEALSKMTDEIRTAAEEVVAEWGHSEPCEVSVGWEHFPRKDYGTLALPAGEYRSLTIRIGAGMGHNWWCVLFPPLCVRAAASEGLPGDVSIVTDCEPMLAGTGFSDAETELITESERPVIRIRFKLLELLQAWFGA